MTGTINMSALGNYSNDQSAEIARLRQEVSEAYKKGLNDAIAICESCEVIERESGQVGPDEMPWVMYCVQCIEQIRDSE
jgi:hypothetical protein